MPEPLTPQELFDSTEWHSRDSLQKLFPVYFQEQYAYKKATGKDVLNKSVNIENFTMKTPFGDQELLKGTDLILESNKRQGLVGANCTGKTLLFSNMSEGKIKDFPKYIHVHHCKELENHELSDTVLGTVVGSHPFRNILIRCEPKIQELLANESTPESQREGLKDTLMWVQQLCRSIRVYDAEERARKMLRVLGFDEVGQAKLCSALSGGLRMRVALCMAFFIEADLLLLDEPTNHLDFPSVLWLENRLRGYKSAFLMVSHDRELLNNVCTSVLLLEDKQIKYYAMGFKEFEKKKATEDKKKFDEIEKFLQKNVNVDPSTMLGKQKHEKKLWSDSYYQKQVALAGKFTFPTATPLSNTEKDADGKAITADNISLINLQNVRFSYDVSTGHFIFNDPISFNVLATTRCGVMGPNGAGKSTLLKLLTHKLIPTEGIVTDHPAFTLAYFGQHSTAELNLEQTPIEFMQSQFPEESAGTLRQHLAKTSVVGTTADTRMHRLSFSQRSCVIFSKLTFVCPHLLIMDEPTNFLDLESVDALIAACNKYKGALLLVSHNRDFLKKCARQYLSVVPGSFKMYDNLKDAESGTYSFIAEMEEGGKVGADALVNTPGGGSIHSSQKTGAAANSTSTTTIENGVKSITIGGGPVQMTTTPKPLVYAVDEKVQALWTDGKFYAAQVVKVDAPGKYSVKYLEYGNVKPGLTAKELKKDTTPAKPAGGKPAAGKAAAGKAAKAK